MDRKESGSDEASSEGVTIDEKGQPLSQRHPVSAA
jgi:hypothetical protein